jgi:hypothetical protein
MEPAVGQSIVTQLGIGGALAVIIAYVMVHVFKLFITHWNKQETDRTEAYKTSSQAHAASLAKMAEQMEKLTTTIGERVADALGDVRLAVVRLESKLDAAFDWQERTPIETKIPVTPSTERRSSMQVAQSAVQSGFVPLAGRRKPEDR